MSRLSDEQKLIVDELSKVEWKSFNKCHAFSKDGMTYTTDRHGKYNILNVFEAEHMSDIFINGEGKHIYSVNLSDKEYFEMLKITHEKECKTHKLEEKEIVSRIIKSLVN